MPHIAMLLSNEYRPDPRVARTASALTEIGFSVTIICWDRYGRGPDREVQDGITILRIAGVRSVYGAGARQILHTPRFWRAALRLLAQIQPDALHCHDLDTLPAGWWYCTRHAIPLIYDAHEDYPALMSLYLPGWMVLALAWIERRLLARTGAVITASTVLADKFRRQGVAEVTTIGNYPDLEPYEQLTPEQIQAARADLGLAPGDFAVGYIGGFSRNRQLEPLLQAAQDMPDVYFLIWGDGHQRNLVADAAEKLPNVRYFGWLKTELVPLYTSVVDCMYYCLVPDYPGAIFNAPNTLANAMAAGRPIIANQVGDLGRMVRETGCGVLLNEVESRQIQAAIREIQSPQRRAELGAAGKAAAEERYNWSNASRYLQQLYRRLLKIDPE